MSVVNQAAYKTLSTLVAGGVAVLWFWVGNEMDLVETPSDSTDWPQFVWTVAGFALAAFFGFRWLFEKWLWRWKVFSWVMRVPDLSGAWSGELESITFGRVHCNVVTIKHQFERLLYQSIRQEDDGKLVATEKTIAFNLRRNADSGQVRLVVVYGNTSGAQKDKFGYDHEGCAVLELLHEDDRQSKWVLQGKYWANKNWPTPRGVACTRGRITLTWRASLRSWRKDDGLQRELYALTKKANVRETRPPIPDPPDHQEE